jgi:hypothetical protein
MSQRILWHKWIYWIAIFGIAIGMPLNKIVLSLSGMLMAANWLIEGQIQLKLTRLKEEKTGILLAALYLILALTLFYTEDLNDGLKDLRIKLPMLLFPIVILSSPALPTAMYRRVILSFVLSVTAVSLVNFIVFQQKKDAMIDARQMSLFDSHIRLSLMVAFSFFVTAKSFFKMQSWRKITAFILAIWFLFYTYKSEVLTGYFSIVIGLFTLALWVVFKKTKISKPILGLGTLISVLGIFYLLYLAVYPIPKEHLNHAELPKKTELGGVYEHDTTSVIRENGYYIHYYVCFSELDSVWRLKTGDNLFSDDNPDLFSTLIRYMTSLGLRKDAQGMAALSNHDILNIQMGYPSIVYAQGGLNARLARITMEIQKHLEGADPNGSTIQQRLEYWKTGTEIIVQNPILGVGIGDVQMAFNQQFEANNSRLHPENRLHTHQQFLTFWIGTGLLGLTIFLIYVVSTLLFALKLNSFALLVFWSIITFSYFFEDTLETQVGVTLSAFFVTFMLKQEKNEKLL